MPDLMYNSYMSVQTSQDSMISALFGRIEAQNTSVEAGEGSGFPMLEGLVTREVTVLTI